ncbi:hypothetical protein H7X46_11550 [Pseudonocardia sp. C8]|uniref:hypothetical protein n=1 Tax=Pseudonocardia sp. C8 TaxID=2762759 RepID=UPI001643509D|nr:hypothetical protein [Pseudonocardia sp. C8]MBC3191696.1 hypothetical protein [Pseudonocardia sp. C8]
MDPDSWAATAAVAAWAGFVATAGAGFFTFRQARTAREALRETKQARQIASDQARSARESATSASKAAEAALWQARNAEMQTQLARAEYDRADRPRFEITAEPVRDDWDVVRARVVESPGMLSVTVYWIAEAVIPDGEIAADSKLSVAPRAETHRHVARNGDVAFGLAVPPAAVRGKIQLTVACAEQDGGRSWPPIPEVVRWERPPEPFAYYTGWRGQRRRPGRARCSSPSGSASTSRSARCASSYACSAVTRSGRSPSSSSASLPSCETSASNSSSVRSTVDRHSGHRIDADGGSGWLASATYPSQTAQRSAHRLRPPRGTDAAVGTALISSSPGPPGLAGVEPGVGMGPEEGGRHLVEVDFEQLTDAIAHAVPGGLVADAERRLLAEELDGGQRLLAFLHRRVQPHRGDQRPGLTGPGPPGPGPPRQPVVTGHEFFDLDDAPDGAVPPVRVAHPRDRTTQTVRLAVSVGLRTGLVIGWRAGRAPIAEPRDIPGLLDASASRAGRFATCSRRLAAARAPGSSSRSRRAISPR